MDLRQILISQPIIDAVKKLNPDANLTPYTKEKGEQGFALVRLSDMHLKTDPIVLKPVSKMGKKIDGTMKQLYTIVDGRHRVAYAIATGNSTIQAVIESWKK